MKKMMAMLLASVMAAGTFTTTAFAYTGDDVQKNTPVSTAAQETDAAESTNAGKTDNTDSIEIDPDMQVLPDGYEVSTDADGNLIVTVGGKEYNIGSEKSQKQTGTVVPGITSLHFRSGPGMDQEIIGYLHSGDTVEIVEKCGDWYKVNFNGKTGYAHGKYLNVTDSAKDSSMFSEDALKLFLDLMQSGMSYEDETKSSAALTPEGNMTLVDDIGEEEDKSSQQFITLVTKAGNTFYLIIDRDKDGNQNVHFLNMVDEADLLALMDEEEAAKYREKEPEVTEPAETEKPQETEPAPEEQKTESEQKKSSPLPMIIDALRKNVRAKHYHVTFEPLFDDPGTVDLSGINWIVVGTMTGAQSRKIHTEPEWAWSLTDQADKLGIPVFMKEDLVSIIGDENMIQEMPEEFNKVLEVQKSWKK